MPQKYNRMSSNDTKGYRSAQENPRYRKVSSSGSVSTTASSSSPANKSIGQRISDKAHALLWVLLAVFTAMKTDAIHIFLSSPTPIRPLLHVAVAQLTVNFVLMLYLGLYLPKIKGVKESAAWPVYCPRVIPFMTGNGILCFLFLMRSLWPAWGFLTPFILSILSMGLLFSSQFVPWI